MSEPVAGLKVAQAGILVMVNDRVVPLGPAAVGVNPYAIWTCAPVEGVPEMVGGGGGAGGAVTVMANAGRDAVCVPSLTEMEMLLNVPTSALVGVPVSAPVAELNEAHAGRLATENVSVELLGPVALGVNAYGWSAGVTVPGVPVMLTAGAVLCWVTVMAKGLSDALREPSAADMTMFWYVPTSLAPGVPFNVP